MIGAKIEPLGAHQGSWPGKRAIAKAEESRKRLGEQQVLEKAGQRMNDNKRQNKQAADWTSRIDGMGRRTVHREDEDLEGLNGQESNRTGGNAGGLIRQEEPERRCINLLRCSTIVGEGPRVVRFGTVAAVAARPAPRPSHSVHDGSGSRTGSAYVEVSANGSGAAG